MTSATGKGTEYRKIALVHHHVHYLPMSESDKLFLMEDAGLFWRKMIEWDVELILHGHKHYATHAIIRYLRPTNGMGREERELMILPAGAAASKDLPANQRNSYYKIECDVFKHRVWHYSYGDVGFAATDAPIEYRKVLRLQIPGVSEAVDMAALKSMLVPETADEDATHYTRIVYEALIDRDCNYTLKITFEGLYDGRASHVAVPVVVFASPQRLPWIRSSADDCIRKSALTAPKIVPHASNVDKLTFRVALPTLKTGERFVVRLEIFIPELMFTERDFDAVGLARFKGGVEEFVYVLRSVRRPHGVNRFAVHRDGPRNLEFRRLDSDFAEETQEGGTNIHVIQPRIPSVAALGDGLVCYYQELV